MKHAINKHTRIKLRKDVKSGTYGAFYTKSSRVCTRPFCNK